jgi:hypothetical protein
MIFLIFLCRTERCANTNTICTILYTSIRIPSALNSWVTAETCFPFKPLLRSIDLKGEGWVWVWVRISDLDVSVYKWRIECVNVQWLTPNLPSPKPYARQHQPIYPHPSLDMYDLFRVSRRKYIIIKCQISLF